MTQQKKFVIHDNEMQARLYYFIKKHKISKFCFVTYFTLFFVIIYFLSCATLGKKGLIEYYALKKQIENHNIIEQDLAKKLKQKKNIVDGVKIESLDLDLLDEEARKSLGYSNKNEVVIYQKESSKKTNKND